MDVWLVALDLVLDFVLQRNRLRLLAGNGGTLLSGSCVPPRLLLDETI
jgi:hypothetical protein